MNKTVNILGVNISNINMQQACARIMDFIEMDSVSTVYTPNSEMIMSAKRDEVLMNIINSGDLVTADGAGVLLASKILGVNLPEKVSGIDMVKRILPTAAQQNLGIYMLGGEPGIAEKAALNIVSMYDNLRISGYRDGYFDSRENHQIIKDINITDTDILLVGMGVPRQEIWIHENKDYLDVGVCMGVGGTLDVFAGKTSLAPEFIRKTGFEWLYRLCREPWRYKRMLDLPRFMLNVLRERVFNRNK